MGAHRGSTCKVCKKQYHACSSCGLNEDYYYEGICSYKCWTESEKYIQYMNIAAVLYHSLDEKQQEMFDHLFIEGSDDLYNELLNRLIHG